VSEVVFAKGQKTMNNNQSDLGAIVKRKRRVESYVNLCSGKGLPEHRKDTFVFPIHAMDSLGWKPGVTKVSFIPNINTKEILLIADADDGYLLSCNGHSNDSVRLTVPIVLVPMLRHWSQVEPGESAKVPLILEVRADDLSVSFGEKTQASETTDLVPLGPENIGFSSNERMLQWFQYDHLQDPLRKVSVYFFELAHNICASCEPGPERTVALRKLLEAKDAAVRARLHPGG
jgi:hypothetical protein